LYCINWNGYRMKQTLPVLQFYTDSCLMELKKLQNPRKVGIPANIWAKHLAKQFYEAMKQWFSCCGPQMRPGQSSTRLNRRVCWIFLQKSKFVLGFTSEGLKKKKKAVGRRKGVVQCQKFTVCVFILLILIFIKTFFFTCFKGHYICHVTSSI
jgi:hypothetical protein